MRTVEGGGRTRKENEPTTVRGAWPSHEPRREPTGRVHDPQSAEPTGSSRAAGARDPGARVGSPPGEPDRKMRDAENGERNKEGARVTGNPGCLAQPQAARLLS